MSVTRSHPSARVDVVIVMYGGAEDLSACIAAARAQSELVARIVVVDNASPDASVAVARELGVEVLENRTNLGYAAAMNQGIVGSDSEFVVSLNADCVLAEGYLTACVAALEAEPRAAAATGLLVLPDGRVDSTGIELTAAGWASDRDRQCAPAEVVSRGEPFGVSGAAAVWRRAALDELGPGPWWPWLFVYWDDVELCWRARRRGWSFVFVPSATALHRRGSDTADANFVEAQSFRNRLATIARHRGWTGVMAPRALLVTTVVGARLALRHPRALRAAAPIAAVRAGLTARREDRALGPSAFPLGPHNWRRWLRAQVTRS